MSGSKTFTVSTEKSAEALIQALHNMTNYKAKNADATEARARVGEQFRFRMLGAGIYNDYTAPVKVDITTNGSEANVTMTETFNINIVAKDRVDEFFARTFGEIEQNIRAAA